jgi:integrase
MSVERRARREGSWRRRDAGWELRKVVGGHRRSFYGPTKAAATAKMEQATGDAAIGLRPTTETVAHYLVAWIDGRASLRPATERRYRQIITGHLVPGLGRYRLSDLQPEHVDRFLRERRKAGQAALTVNHMRTLLAAALGEAEKRGHVARNVARLSEPERVAHHEVQFLDPEQVASLHAALTGHRLQALVMAAVYTGLRQGELLGLRWEDLDLDSATLRVRRALQRGEFVDTKTGRSRRTLDLPGAVVSALRQHRAAQAEQRLAAGRGWQDHGLVFCKPDGRPLNGTAVTHAFQSVLTAARLPALRFHDLRHTHVALLIHLGVQPRVIMERLGHSTISTTMDIYGHIFPAAGREAADRLDQMFASTASGQG